MKTDVWVKESAWLTKWLRAWQRWRCSHPFEQTELPVKLEAKTGKINTAFGDVKHIVNVRRCHKCDRHYLDEGWEYATPHPPRSHHE